MPLDSELVLRARDLARSAHQGQVRKASQLPYFSHLEAVAELLSEHGYDDDETLAVGFLHDLLEDQPEFEHALRTQMPSSVVERVEVLSEKKCDDQGRPLPKSERFDGYLTGLRTGGGVARAAIPVSCADRIHNSMSLVADERDGHRPFMRLSSRPGELLDQLARLRKVYEGHVNDALLESFDRARTALEDTIRRWLPGRAVAMAADAHLGQFDKSGGPYVYHPLVLAMRASNQEERMVAWLHDTIEDSELTLDALAKEGFGTSIVRAVDHLTRRREESYDEFIERVARDRLATRVKLLDLAHNSDLSRIAEPGPEDRKRGDRYRRATLRLERELSKRSLMIVLDDESRERLRPLATLAVFKGHHVTLAHRVLPEEYDPSWVPGEASVGSLVEMRALGLVSSGKVEAVIVQIAGTSVRPIDTGTLHVTLSRSENARSREANDLLRTGQQTPIDLYLRGTISWADS